MVPVGWERAKCLLFMQNRLSYELQSTAGTTIKHGNGLHNNMTAFLAYKDNTDGHHIQKTTALKHWKYFP